jgi:hypothetical protein
MNPQETAALRELVRAAIAQANELDADGDQCARNAEQVTFENGIVRAFVTLEAVPCQHEWTDDDEGRPVQCRLCGMSFMRYAFSEMP